MITDELLERGLANAAEEYDVPADALMKLRSELSPAPVRRRLHVRMPRLQTRGRWLAAAVAVIALVGIAIGVGGTNSGSPDRNVLFAGKSPSGVPPKSLDRGAFNAAPRAIAAQPPTTVTAGGLVGAHAPAGTTPSVPSVPSVVPNDSLTKIISTGEIDLQAAKGRVHDTYDRLVAIATLEGGFVANSETNEGSDPTALVTLRVPSSAFDATITKVRGITGAKVLSLQTKTQDVTASYVDLKARLHALSTTRSTYLTILSRASSIGDILAVQSRINDIQMQIEQLQGQLNVLTDQTSFGTLTVTVDQKAAPAAVVHRQSGMSRAFHRSVDRFVNGTEAIVGVVGPIALVVLILAVLWFGSRLGYRVLRRRMV